jgi:hypothetical protein
MRISHAEVEDCISNPRRWIAQKIGPSVGGPRTGYDGATKLAIYKFHATSRLLDAQQHLDQLLLRLRLTNPIQADRARDNLNSYVDWVMMESPAVSNWKLRLDLDLSSGWTLGGEVSRVDVDLSSGGYRGILIGNRPNNWRSQVRMPLIQRALAARLQRPETEILVGFQKIDGSALEVASFPRMILDDAENTARELARRLSEEMQRQSGF